MKTKNTKAAQQTLDKIVSYTGSTAQARPNVNNLVTAWALKKNGRGDEAEKFLKDILAKNPSNKIAQWTLDVYEGKASTLDTESNESYALLQQWMALNK